MQDFLNSYYDGHSFPNNCGCQLATSLDTLGKGSPWEFI